MSQLARDHSWSLSVYKLYSSRELLDSFVPGRQLITRLKKAIQFWPNIILDDGAIPLIPLEDLDEGMPDIPGLEPDIHLDMDYASDGDDDDDSDDEHPVEGKGKALNVVLVLNGSISFYADGRFEAVCRCEEPVFVLRFFVFSNY